MILCYQVLIILSLYTNKIRKQGFLNYFSNLPKRFSVVLTHLLKIHKCATPCNSLTRIIDIRTDVNLLVNFIKSFSLICNDLTIQILAAKKSEQRCYSTPLSLHQQVSFNEKKQSPSPMWKIILCLHQIIFSRQILSHIESMTTTGHPVFSQIGSLSHNYVSTFLSGTPCFWGICLQK